MVLTKLKDKGGLFKVCSCTNNNQTKSVFGAAFKYNSSETSLVNTAKPNAAEWFVGGIEFAGLLTSVKHLEYQPCCPPNQSKRV